MFQGQMLICQDYLSTSNLTALIIPSYVHACTLLDDSCLQFCQADVPGVLRLRKLIQQDVRSKIQHLSRVNYLWHGAKRVPVSFVPFGGPLASRV